MINFLNKHMDESFIFEYLKEINHYLNDLNIGKLDIFFDNHVFFEIKENKKIVNIKCSKKISEIDFLYHLFFYLNKENDWLKFIEKTNINPINLVLEKSFNNNNIEVLKKIVLYEYKKIIDYNNTEYPDRKLNVEKLKFQDEKKLLSISNDTINYIKDLIKYKKPNNVKSLIQEKIKILDFLIKELSANKINRLDNEEFLNVYSTILDKEKEIQLHYYYGLQSLISELTDLKESFLLKENSNIEENELLNQENILFLDNILNDLIDKFCNSALIETYYQYYINKKNSKNVIKHIKNEEKRELNNKKNEIVIGNSGTGKSHTIFKKYNQTCKLHIKTVYITDTNHDYFKKIIIEGMLDYFYSIINSTNQLSRLPENINRETRIIIDESNRNNFQDLINRFNFLIENDNYSKNYEICKLKPDVVREIKEKYNNIEFTIFKGYKEKDKKIQKEINMGILLVEIENVTLRNNIKKTIEFFFSENVSVEEKEVEIPLCAFPSLEFTLIMNTVDINTQQIDLMLNRRCSINYIGYEIDINHENFQILKSNTDDLLYNSKKHYKTIDWLKLQNILNKIIEEYCHDSKCIGYYFWTDYIEENNKKIIKFNDFKNKIIYYIYGNVLNNFDKDYFKYNIKDEKNKLFFQNKKSFNQLMCSNDMTEIFSKKILNSLELVLTDYPKDKKKKNLISLKT